MGRSSAIDRSNQMGKKKAVARPLILASKRASRPERALETRAPRALRSDSLAFTTALAPWPAGNVVGSANLAWPITEPFTSRSARASSSLTSTGAVLLRATSASMRREPSSEPTRRTEMMLAETLTEDAKMYKEPKMARGIQMAIAKMSRRRLLNLLTWETSRGTKSTNDRAISPRDKINKRVGFKVSPFLRPFSARCRLHQRWRRQRPPRPRWLCRSSSA